MQSTLHRNQSPSPSRGSSRASSSPVSSTSYISDACTSLSKAEDATTATSTSMSSSPVNAGPSSYRAQWVLSRKLSGRSRFSELQGKLDFLYFFICNCFHICTICIIKQKNMSNTIADVIAIMATTCTIAFTQNVLTSKQCLISIFIKLNRMKNVV